MKEQRAILRIGAVLIIALLFLMIPAGGSLADDALKNKEQQMLDLINQERIVRNLKPLTIDPSLTVAARGHSQEMITLNYFSHESPITGNLEARIKNAGVKGWAIIGENLAGAQDVKVAHDALMKSEGHRKNILNPNYTHIGIGIAKGSQYGKMFTQNFVKYVVGSQGSIDSGKVVSVDLGNKEDTGNVNLTKKKSIKRKIKRF